MKMSESSTDGSFVGAGINGRVSFNMTDNRYKKLQPQWCRQIFRYKCMKTRLDQEKIPKNEEKRFWQILGFTTYLIKGCRAETTHPHLG